MAEFKKDILGRPNTYVWSKITADDCVESLIDPGTYNMEVKGTFGGASVGLLASTEPTATVAIKDSTGTAAYTAASGLVIVGPIGETFARPKITGGSSYDLTLILTRVKDGN